ncbi:efflux RND transporter periplasmic adaptor subunit [bacterium]|nr:MAG: efflux RND transporter periplasmic adaptor subunit [bacterium]
MKSTLPLIIVLGLLAACSKEEAPEQTTAAETSQTTTEEAVKVVNVSTKELENEPFTSFIRLIGEVKAVDDIKYSAEVSGKIVKYYIPEGGKVSVGDVIAKIDDEMLKKDVERMEAVVASTYENYKRLESIWKEDSIGTEIGYLNAKYLYEQNKASLDQLKIQLRKTNVTSPINGVVESQLVKAGELVGAGTPMVRIIGTDKVKIEVGVPANYAAVIHKGDAAEISFDAYVNKTFKSDISYVASSIQTQSRTFKVEIELPNKNNELKIDMVANVILETASFDEAIVISQEYVFRTENGYELFIASKEKDGKWVAKSRKVTLGPSFNNRVVIDSGVKPGELLITGGSGNIENMTRIAVVDTTESKTMAAAN